MCHECTASGSTGKSADSGPERFGNFEVSDERFGIRDSG
jgi:hypothetical protein